MTEKETDKRNEPPPAGPARAGRNPGFVPAAAAAVLFLVLGCIRNREKTALVLIDLQERWRPVYEETRLLSVIHVLTDKSRETGTPVIWIRTTNVQLPESSPNHRFFISPGPAAEDPVIDKKFADGFAETDLERTLCELWRGRIVVAGVNSSGCVAETVNGALRRGIRVVLVTDGHSESESSTESLVREMNARWEALSGEGIHEAVPSFRVKF